MGIFDIIKKGNSFMSIDQLAEVLKMDKEKLKAFEDYYNNHAIDIKDGGIFDTSSHEMSDIQRKKFDKVDSTTVHGLVDRIVNELLDITSVYKFDGKLGRTENKAISSGSTALVNRKELESLEECVRPQLTGQLMKVDIKEPSYKALLFYYNSYMKNKNNKTGRDAYNHFRQGLDILDLDEITYKIIGTNKNSMGYWLPKLVEGLNNQTDKHRFFKVPATTIAKVPITLLQLTRLDYESLTKTTLDIVDKWAYKAFELDESKEYFIKTGTYSSKFDFRNAKVTGPKEVRELGEYLLFIHNQAIMMASPLNIPCIYGVSTTNEWVVREFIRDKENNPCIYKGLPLHTEYRVFIDGDTRDVIGISPYWEPNTMKERFSSGSDKDSPHMKHDYVVYKAHEDILMKRYIDNRDKVIKEVIKLLHTLNIPGQWSIDIMQNGNDFWIIDMAIAENSAFYSCVPARLRKQTNEDWLMLGN